MDETGFIRLLDLASGGLLLTTVLVLWRRRPAVVIRVFVAQGVLLAGLVAVLAGHGDQPGSLELWAATVGILVLRAGVLPYLLRRVLPEPDAGYRPLVGVNVSVSASLLVAAALTLLGYLVSRPLVELAPSASARAVPIGVTVVLVGFFVLVSRRRALSQLAGILLMDNGITAVGFLTAAGLGLVVEIGLALDVLLVLLVLQLRTAGTRAATGDTDLDELRELRDS